MTIAGAALALLAGCGGHTAAAPPSSPSAANPSTPSTAAGAGTPAPASEVTCADITGVLQPVVANMNAQDQTFAQMGTTEPLETRQDMAAGEWTDPGTYSGSLDAFLAAEAAVTPDTPADPSQLNGDVPTMVVTGKAVQNDMENGGGTNGQPIGQDWPQFQQAVVAVAYDCGLTISPPWTT